MTLHHSAIVTVTLKKFFFSSSLTYPSHLVQIEDGAGAALGYASREHFFFSLKGLDGCFADIPQASAHHLAKLFFLPISLLVAPASTWKKTMRRFIVISVLMRTIKVDMDTELGKGKISKHVAEGGEV